MILNGFGLIIKNK